MAEEAEPLDEEALQLQIDRDLAASASDAPDAAAQAAAAESTRAAEAETARVAAESAAATAASEEAARIAAAAAEQPVKTAEEIAAEEATATAARVAAIAANPEDAEGRYKVTGKLAAVVQLTKAGVPEAEAIARIYGKQPAPEPVPAEEVKPDVLDTLRAELATVESDLDGKAEDETLMTAEVRKQMRREQELREQIRVEETKRKEAKKVEAQATLSEFDTNWAESEKWVADRYPQALVKDSPLNKRVAERIEAIAADENHPLYGNDKLPELLYPQEAAELGILPVKKTAATPPLVKGLPPASGAAKVTPQPIANEAVAKAAFKQREAQAVADGDDEELYRLAEEEASGAPVSQRNNSGQFHVV